MARFCEKCGKEIEENSSFCSNCGAAVAITENNTNQNQQYNNQNTNNSYNPKSKIGAGILGILLGAFGIHNFYLGYNGKAVAQLLITVLTCGIASVVSGIWGLVEGIMILTGNIDKDANGVPLEN